MKVYVKNFIRSSCEIFNRNCYQELKILLRLIISDHMPWFGDKQKQTQNYNKPSTYLWNGDTKRQDLGKFK